MVVPVTTISKSHFYLRQQVYILQFSVGSSSSPDEFWKVSPSVNEFQKAKTAKTFVDRFSLNKTSLGSSGRLGSSEANQPKVLRELMIIVQ